MPLAHEWAVTFGRLAANHLWQSTGFAAVAVVLALALRANSARARYWLWLAASVKFLIPFSVLAAIGGQLGRWIVPAAPVARAPLAIEEIVQPFAPLQGAGVPAAVSVPAPATAGLLPVVLLAIWFCGLVAVLLCWWVRWRRVAAAVRSSTPMREGREVEALRRIQSSAYARAATFNPEGVKDSSPRRKPWETEGACAAPAGAEDGATCGPGSFAPDGAGMVSIRPMACAMGYFLTPLRGWLRRLAGVWPAIRLVSSTARLEPGVFGIFRPVLWLPAGIGDRLDDAELEAILAHELCHARRRDNLAAAVHMAVEAMFWFHPLVWWLGARLTEERERAYDEEVVRMGGEPQVYAESILKVCEFYLASPVACAAGVSGGGLKRRIESIMANRIFHKLNLAQKVLLAVAAIGAVAGPIAAGLFGQTVPPPAFEVASVKISGPPELGMLYRVTGGPGTHDPGRFHGPHMSMLAMLIRAFGVAADQIHGPAGQTSYDIDATMPPDTTKEQFQQMFQNLLIERFHLVFHRETRNFPGYALVVDTGGPKIKEVAPDPSPVAITPEVFLQAAQGEDGFALQHGPATMFQPGPSGKWRTKYQERSMAEFVADLGGLIASSQGKGSGPGDPRPRVVDKTGLTGKYTFILEYYDAVMASAIAGLRAAPGPALPGLRAAENPGGGGGAADNQAPTAADPAGGADIFHAIRKQLGLRLDKTADVPLGVIVVESVDKTPTEN